MATYRFPSPISERVGLVASVFVGLGCIALVLVTVGRVAAGGGLTPGDVFGLSGRLRALMAALVAVWALHAGGVAAFLYLKGAGRLEVGETEIRWRRGGLPGFRVGAQSVSFETGTVERIQVEKVRRGIYERVEVRIAAGRKEIAVNLGHAEGEGCGGAVALPPREKWKQHPLVEALERATGRTAELL